MKRAPSLMILVLAAAITGCWPFHRETPQQKFLDAINKGESAKASEIWLNMSPEDKMKFAHNEGLKPGVSPEQVKKQIVQHYVDEAGGPVESGNESIEQVSPNISGAGLQNLPSLAAPSGAAPAPPGATGN